MAFQKLLNGAKAVTLFRVDGVNDWTISQWYTKLNFDSADMINLGQAIQGALITHLMPQLCTVVELISTTVYDQRDPTAGKVVVTPVGPEFGADVIAPAPINTAVVVTLRTLSRGRFGRGRNYITGFSDNNVTDDAFLSVAWQAVETAYANMKTDTLAQGWTMVVASFQQDLVPLDPGVGREVVTIEVRKALAGTQRRRIRRG